VIRSRSGKVLSSRSIGGGQEHVVFEMNPPQLENDIFLV
jgi:hypothetical protein